MVNTIDEDEDRREYINYNMRQLESAGVVFTGDSNIDEKIITDYWLERKALQERMNRFDFNSRTGNKFIDAFEYYKYLKATERK
jgi:hypothetical protein